MKTEVVLYKHSGTFNLHEGVFVTVSDHTLELTPSQLLNKVLEVAHRQYHLSDFNITVLDK